MITVKKVFQFVSCVKEASSLKSVQVITTTPSFYSPVRACQMSFAALKPPQHTKLLPYSISFELVRKILSRISKNAFHRTFVT